jgi:hypothetical protein
MFYPFAGNRSNPDIHWHDDRHATVYHNGRIWELHQDEASDWLIFVQELTEPVYRIASGGYSEAFRWIAGRPRFWTVGNRGGNR